MEERSITTVYEEHVVTKNPIFYLQEGIKAILKCLGFESSSKSDHESESSSSSSSSSMSSEVTTKKEEEEKNIKEDESEQEEHCGVFQEDDKQESEAKADVDPPQSQTLIIEAATGRGRPPARPGVGRGPPPQNN